MCVRPVGLNSSQLGRFPYKARKHFSRVSQPPVSTSPSTNLLNLPTMRFPSFTNLVVLSLVLVGANAAVSMKRDDPIQQCLTTCGATDLTIIFACLQAPDQCPPELFNCITSCLATGTGGCEYSYHGRLHLLNSS
ncbi:hypothetical protein BDN72DRAFT_429410 [Pluteus cervinus]|uniref:Uncharacterized protein n=1 Tax=Pluteus cervinus TaxID=181527 RepID=A0ACD3AAB0_9AGAR|nr:hypothetical protein BDN72DRAFT_429410 [Pluteus cervinus]